MLVMVTQALVKAVEILKIWIPPSQQELWDFYQLHLHQCKKSLEKLLKSSVITRDVESKTFSNVSFS